MQAFWLGEFGQNGLVLRYRNFNKPGFQETTCDRESLATNLMHIELERLSDRGTGAQWKVKEIEALEGLTMTDYRTRSHFPFYFERDPEGILGLAAPRAEFDRWRNRSVDSAQLQSTNPKKLLPKSKLLDFLRAKDVSGGSLPAADVLYLEARQAFPHFEVRRDDVRAAHREVWGPQRRGKRPKRA